MSTSTLRERILTSIAALLNPIPDCVVYRSREAALARAEGPAILIRPEEEQVQSTAQFVVWRHFRVGISVIARDDIPDQTADPIILAIQTAMLADQTLGGLCARIFEEETKWDFEVADQNVVAAMVSYRLVYATPVGSLTQQA